MGLNIGQIDPQTIQKLLFGGPQAAMMPPLPDQPAPPPQPPAQAAPAPMQTSATPSPLPAAPVAPAPKPASYEDPNDYATAHPEAVQAHMQPRPVGDFDTGKHAGLRRALATMFGGLAEFGGDINHTPGQGAKIFSRWADQDAAQRAYDTGMPQMKAGAVSQAFKEHLGQTGQLSTIAHTDQETANLAANNPMVARKSTLMDHLQKDLEDRALDVYSPDALKLKYLRIAQYHDVQVAPEELDQAIQNTKPLGPKYTLIKGEGGIPEALQDRQGKQYGPDQIPTDPEAQTLWQAAQKGRKQAQQDKVDVASAEGRARANIEAATARGSNAALANVPPHLIGPATDAATKAGTEFAQAQSVSQRLNAMMDAARKGNVVSYQLIPEEGALQLVTSQGIHRINMTEIQNYGGGSLWQKMQGHLGKALTGASIPESVLNDMAEMQKLQGEGARARYENTLKTVNQNYGSAFKPLDMELPGSAQKVANHQHVMDYAKQKAITQQQAEKEFKDAGYTVQ